MSNMAFEAFLRSTGDAVSAQSIRLRVYLAWVDAWGSYSDIQKVTISQPDDAIDLRPEDVFARQLEDSAELEPSEAIEIPSLSTNEMADYFQEENLPYLLKRDILDAVIRAFHQNLAHRRIKVGGRLPPSCPETNVFSGQYDPRVECRCEGYRRQNEEAEVDLSSWQNSECQAIRRTVKAVQTVTDRQSEYKSQGIFTNQGLVDAAIDLFLSSSHVQSIPDTCQGSGIVHPIPEIKAPDRRPSPTCDSDPTVYDALMLTTEKIKLCADAKHFFAMACGGSLVDQGLLQAIADSGNDILIGDYCDVADENTISILQNDGAAAIAFLKLCTYADVVTRAQFDGLVASLIQFRALGYYRDHGRDRLASGLFGSHYSHVLSSRYIDLALWPGIMSASLATGKNITAEGYRRLATVCTLLNDLVDLRSDTMRKQRENPILRGVRGCLCNYLDSCTLQCLSLACQALDSDRLSGMVVLGFCNWAVMASHHKVYELVNGVQEVRQYSTCEYTSSKDERPYENLLKALDAYGTLGQEGPNVYMRRADMDQLYAVYRAKPETHIAWMADIARSLLKPDVLRKLVDVVHFEWNGDTGDREFCP